MLHSFDRGRSLAGSICCIPLLMVVLLAGGCSSLNLKEFYFGDLFGKGSSTIDKNAEQLAVEGVEQMRKKDFDEAVKAFRKLKEQYPYSKYAILAELKLGDALYYDKKYAEAAVAYEEFARLHPRNEVVPYVLYQVGMSHFLLFSTTDRDPEETRAAAEAFKRVVQTFPQSEYSTRAKKQLAECNKRIVAHEFDVGSYYYRVNEFWAAKGRLEKLDREYSSEVKTLGYEKDLKKMLAKCEQECSKGEKRPGIWTRLGF